MQPVLLSTDDFDPFGASARVVPQPAPERRAVSPLPAQVKQEINAVMARLPPPPLSSLQKGTVSQSALRAADQLLRTFGGQQGNNGKSDASPRG
jgi:hypothetical protein